MCENCRPTNRAVFVRYMKGMLLVDVLAAVPFTDITMSSSSIALTSTLHITVRCGPGVSIFGSPHLPGPLVRVGLWTSPCTRHCNCIGGSTPPASSPLSLSCANTIRHAETATAPEAGSALAKAVVHPRCTSCSSRRVVGVLRLDGPRPVLRLLLSWSSSTRGDVTNMLLRLLLAQCSVTALERSDLLPRGDSRRCAYKFRLSATHW